MKTSQLTGARFKEVPAECQLASHTLMVRGGYIKNVGSGMFSLFLPAKRIAQKIEKIIREEMDAIGGQEVMFPVAMPASLWKESGRFDSVGSELIRFKDRNGSDLILGMTHEEAAVHLSRDAAPSYQNYPFMIYQIQTKFRDEPRSRGGLIRTREFTMKDAYSFHTSQEDLEAYYEEAYAAYAKIFARAGLSKDVIAVQSDSGMMGGKIAHEFMLIADAGEDTLVLCDSCDLSSNMEVAECIVEQPNFQDEPIELVETPNMKTIEALCEFLKIEPRQTCKAVMYRANATNELIIAFIRGDLEINETKLRNLLKAEIHPDETPRPDVAYGYTGPYNFTAKARLIFDRSVENLCGLVTGANKEGFHYKGFSPKRDCQGAEFFDIAKTKEGAICPKCGNNSVIIRKGIEVGNIFQLGTKYTESMNMQYLAQDGKARHPIMGCYGIGVGRLMASVCEASHDDYGPIWPMAIAPWQVQICALRADDPAVSSVSNALYEELQAAGIEVIYDDRIVSAGVMFSDADLLGVPIRVIVSPKTVARGVLEIKLRDKSYSGEAEIKNGAEAVMELYRKIINGE